MYTCIRRMNPLMLDRSIEVFSFISDFQACSAKCGILFNDDLHLFQHMQSYFVVVGEYIYKSPNLELFGGLIASLATP